MTGTGGTAGPGGTGGGGPDGCTMLDVGARAPDFEAPASDGRTYSLGALLARGTVALFFYPGNNTPG